jgi:hypothetical protein
MAAAVGLLSYFLKPATVFALAVVVLLGMASYAVLNLGVIRGLRREQL